VLVLDRKAAVVAVVDAPSQPAIAGPEAPGYGGGAATADHDNGKNPLPRATARPPRSPRFDLRPLDDDTHP
jgi:hypothetical protein